MASKRSQVQGLQTITSNQPVARPVDTFVQYRPPAEKKGASELLDALSTLSPVLGKLAESNRKIKEAKEATIIDREFLTDPDKFVADFTAGKYKDFMAPSQILAGEHMGKRLARQYGAELNQAYAESGLIASEDPTAFFAFEEKQRSTFIEKNRDYFSQNKGIVTGFAGSFKNYTTGLDSQHMATAIKNKKENQKANFKVDITSKIDAVLAGTLDAQSFSSEIRLSQNDSKLGYNFDNKLANEQTIDAIVEYATTDPDLGYEDRHKVLNLAYAVETTKGSFLGNTQEAQFKIGKARTAIDDAERKKRDEEYKLHTQMKSLATDAAQSKIINALSENSNVQFSTLFTPKELGELNVLFPDIKLYFEQQQNFFTGVSQEVDSADLIAMRSELGKSLTTEAARRQIAAWQSTGRLKNNPTVFNILWQQADKIKEIKPSEQKDFTSDKYYTTYFKLLGGVDPNTGFSPFAAADPRNAALTEFFEGFVDLFYTRDYQNLSPAQKRDAVKVLFKKAKDSIAEDNRP